MTSSERFRRRCIIKKLDFENCIVTNSKTTARGRKKLRARITQEVEDVVSDDQDLDVPTPDESRTSPVLMRSQMGTRRSPVLLKRRKVNIGEEEEDPERSTVIEEPRSPSSPVFKLLKKSKIFADSACDRVENTEGKLTGVSEENSSSCLENSYHIDDATTQESKHSVRISSVESADLKKLSRSVSSPESSTLACRDSPGQSTSAIDVSKRNHRNSRNRLLRRLHKLQQKQASEKLLWQHQNRRNSASSLRFTVVTFWKDDFNFFLKCSSPTDLSVTFLVVDNRWVPSLRHVKKSSVLLLHPPWQKITLEESNTTVLMNVTCLDVLDEVDEGPVGEKRQFEWVPTEPFQTRQKLCR